MDRRRAEIAAAVGMWVFLVLLALASADKPPPPGFLLLALLLAGWCALIRWAMGPAHDWGLWVVALIGAGAAVAVNAVLIVIKVATEGWSVPREAAIGVAVLVVCGAVAAAVQYAAARLLWRRDRPA